MGNEFVGTGNGKLYQELMGANGLLRSISDEINADAFNATQQFTGTYIANQAIIANKDSIEIMKIEAEQKKKEDEALDVVEAAGEAAREEAERIAQEKRAEAWMNESHTYGGQTMNATQWLATIDWFQDEDNVAAWEAEMVRRTGQPISKIRKTKTKMDELDDLILKESRGENLTDAEKNRKEVLNNDKDVKTGYGVRAELVNLDNAVTNDANVKAGANSIAQRTNAMEIAEGAATSINNESVHQSVSVGGQVIKSSDSVVNAATSISKSIDNVGATSGLTSSFNQIASVTNAVPEKVTPIMANNQQPIKVANNFDASSGMI